jgi:single-strand DNA-binding protein
MKNITLAGRLTKDAEVRDVGSDRVTGFSVAVDDRSGKTKSTLFFECSMWGKRGEAVAQYLTKGSSVTVSGDLGTREHNGKTYLSCRVNDLTLQGGKAAVSDSQEPTVRTLTAQAAYDLSDDIPF